jgi:16S rRNA (guanine527-N7)-methyltransferase
MELIRKYFPVLTPTQTEQFAALDALYRDWNARINVISRKDEENLYERHVLHSLGIARVMAFTPGSRVLDVGTGGGFPGIPLAILFPDTRFLLVDSIGKKITVVNGVAEALGLQNVEARHERAEKVKERFDLVVSRAVTAIGPFMQWMHGKFLKEQRNPLPNGVLYLKGGDLTEELQVLRKPYQLFDLKDYFDEPFFDTKKVLFVPMGQ